MPTPSIARRRRLYRADEAAGDVARGFTAFVGLMVAPGHAASGDRLHRIALHRGRRRRRRCAQHVVRRRHRRAHGAHRRPAGPGRARRAGRGARFRPDARGVLRRRARPPGQLSWPARCSPSRSASMCSIYTMWLKRWTPQNIVIGGAAGALPPMIGWAAVTGSVASSRLCCSSSSSSGRRRISGRCRSIAPRTMRAPAYRCCRWSPAKRKPAARSCSIRCCSRRSARRLAARLCRSALWHRRRRGRRGAGRSGAAGARRERRAGRRRQQADVRLLDPLSVPAVCDAAGRSAAAALFGHVCGMTMECD